MNTGLYLFIGEDRSETAIKRNVRWEDGALAAKQLFDALKTVGINPTECRYMNVFEPLRQQGILHKDHTHWINVCAVNGYVPVAMGRKVQKELRRLGVANAKYIHHPAARGLIRRKSVYAAHVGAQLLGTTSK